MQTSQIARRAVLFTLLACFCAIFAASTLYSASVVEFTAIGKVESIYRDRITMRILEMVGSESVELPVSKGSWVSFDLPREMRDKNRRRDRGQISFGNVIEAQLIGNIATEYEVKEGEDAKEKVKPGVPTVLLWTAQAVTKVKNGDQYLPEEERTAKKSRKKGRRKEKEKKEEEPVKIWTQEETVRGSVLVKGEKVYIKEDRLGKKDKGLELASEEWLEKLKELAGSRVVVHGVTHRTSVSSGTVEIKNIMRVYPK